MSVSSVTTQLENARKALERERAKQAAEEQKAARADTEAARYRGQAGRASSPSFTRNYLRQAEQKDAEVRKAREQAVRASKAVAAAQIKVHGYERDLRREIERESKRARDQQAREERQRSQREAAERRRTEQQQRAEEARRRAADLARDRELADLSQVATSLRRELAAKPWEQAPPEILVLFIASSPEDQDPLRIDREVREIQRRLRASEHRDAVKFEYRLATQLKDLLQALNEIRPHVVHFSGHGDQDVLVFEDDDGRARELTNSDLAQLLHVSSERIRLAVFNSCRSSDQAELACTYVDAAIGMSTSINDEPRASSLRSSITRLVSENRSRTRTTKRSCRYV